MKRFISTDQKSVRLKIDKAFHRGDWESCDNGVLFWTFELAFLMFQDEDVAQVATMRVWLNRNSFRGESALSTWITSVLSREIADSITAEMTKAIYEMVECDLTPVIDCDGNQMSGFDIAVDSAKHDIEDLGGERMSPITRKALAVDRERLPNDRARKMFVQQSLGWSIEEIAAANGCTIAAVKNSMKRGRQFADAAA